MPMKRIQTISVVMLSLAVLGCTGPEIAVRHHLGNPIGMAVDPGQLQGGQFGVQPEPDPELATYLQDKLRQRLTDIPHTASAPSEQTLSATRLAVVGLITVEAEDSRGTRHIRRWNPQLKDLEDLEVASLRRDVTVAVQFVLQDITGRTDEVALETHRSYSTHQDPDIRGEWGLLRPDDPESVPHTEKIAQRLIDQCLDDFIAMIHPYELAADIPLRHVWGSEAAAGQHAAERGDYDGATESYLAALQASPDSPNLHFNLAVVTEAAGDLATAEEHYRRALELQRQPDEQIQAGLERIERVRRTLNTTD